MESKSFLFFSRGSFVFVCVNNVSRFVRVTFLGVLSGLFRGLLVTSIWVIKRSLGRSWLFFLILLVFVWVLWGLIFVLLCWCNLLLRFWLLLALPLLLCFPLFSCSWCCFLCIFHCLVLVSVFLCMCFFLEDGRPDLISMCTCAIMSYCCFVLSFGSFTQDHTSRGLKLNLGVYRFLSEINMFGSILS